MSSLLHDLGVWCFRRAKTVVALWLVLLALLGVGAVSYTHLTLPTIYSV